MTAKNTKSIQAEAAQQRAASNARPVHYFTIPKTVANGIEEMGFVQLTSSEELQATKRSHNDMGRLAFEMAKQALVEVNGEKVNLRDGSSDAVWNKMDPKVRTLAVAAFGHLHTPEEEDVNSFLKSQRVEVG